MEPLGHVIVATMAFVGTHLLMSHPLRAPLVAQLGERGFMLAYSLVSFATLGWMVWVLKRVGPEPFLWTAPAWLWAAGAVVMLLASILLVGSLIGNPALPGMPASAPVPRGVFAITRHPMMWGFALWALVHAAVWPQPSVLVLTGGIALLALVGAAGQDAKKKRLQPEFWPEWMRRTSFVPFARGAAWPGWGVTMAGVALWLVAMWAHPRLGAPVVSPLPF